MFWWFERQGQLARYEVLALPSGTYELRVIDPDGAVIIHETFQSSSELAARQAVLENVMRAQGWSGPFGWIA